QLSTACLGCCSARKLSGLVLRQRDANDIAKPDAAGRNWTSFCERSPRRQVAGSNPVTPISLRDHRLRAASLPPFAYHYFRSQDLAQVVSPRQRLIRLVGKHNP